jgi:hypothetical protein
MLIYVFVYPRITRTAYLLGNAGNYLVASLVFNANNDDNNRDKCLDNYIKLSDYCISICYLPKGITISIIFTGKYGT